MMFVIQKSHELIILEWKVVDIFANAENESFKCFTSPTFPFADTRWHLLLTGQFSIHSQSTSLILIRNEHHNCSIEYTFGLKKVDGSVEFLDRGIMKDDQEQIEHHFVKLLEVLQQRSSELAPSGSITITLSLKLVGQNNTYQPKCKKLKRLHVLPQNSTDLLTQKVACDTVLRVKETEFQAHKAVLTAHSRVFSSMFQRDNSEKQTDIIRIPDCDPRSFPLFLEFLYTGRLGELSHSSALHLFETSEKYGVLELKTFCREQLIEKLTERNWCDVICIADMYSDEKLLAVAQNFFIANYRSIFHSSGWEQLMRNNVKLASKVVKELP